jgi:ADP-heptose:LPS heptosyltransferase
VNWYSLQVDWEVVGFPCQDLRASIRDFADTAALVDQLDLVISVDTAIVHLAGMMGKATFVLLPAVPDFRWLLDRTDTPWYPTAHLFRQQHAGDWPSVIERVRRVVADIVTTGPTP